MTSHRGESATDESGVYEIAHDGAAPAKKVPAQAGARRTEEGSLAVYFREMSERDLLGPGDEEAEAALEIVASERAHWVALFSFAPSAKPILDMLREGAEARVVAQDPEEDSVPAGTDPLPEEPGEVKARRIQEILGKIKGLAKLLRRKVPVRGEAFVACVEALAGLIRLPDVDRAWVAKAREIAGEHPNRAYAARVAETRAACTATKNRFVEANLRLVVSAARRYNRGGGMAMADLLQEGNVGLLKAVDQFDPTRGYRFSTYGSWWIRHAISRALADKSRMVRVPVHLLDARGRVVRASQAIRAQTGRPPTHAELEAQTGLSPAKLAKIDAVCGGDAALSLDRPVGDEDGRTFLDKLEDDAPSPFDRLADKEWGSKVRRLIGILPPLHAAILRGRFGLDTEALTLQQLGDKHKLSRERIRQIQEIALAKLRARMQGQ